MSSKSILLPATPASGVLLAADVVDGVGAATLARVPVEREHDVDVDSPASELDGVGRGREVGTVGELVERVRVGGGVLEDVADSVQE